jgi:kanamycin kinase
VGAEVYDISSSPEAHVYFIDKDGGYYLKTAAAGALSREAELTGYFHSKKLAPEVLAYISAERDFMLTERVRGEDMTFRKYLAEPKKLCDLSASLLRELHETDFSACPVKDHSARYLETASKHHANGEFDLSFAPEFETADEAYAYLTANSHLLKNEVLLHGDYCLPNVILDGFRVSSFIDLGNSGIVRNEMNSGVSRILGFNLPCQPVRFQNPDLRCFVGNLDFFYGIDFLPARDQYAMAARGADDLTVFILPTDKLISFLDRLRQRLTVCQRCGQIILMLQEFLLHR